MPPVRPQLLRFPSPLSGAGRRWGLRHAASLGALAVSLSMGGSSCYYSDNGSSPPAEGFYFPTGLVVSPGRNTLYVANSDFDLQYNGGTVQTVDLTDATGLRGTLGPMLAGIRCSGGITSACSSGPGVPGAPQGVTVNALCNGILESTGTGANGVACQSPSRCVSGYCAIGSDGINGTCQSCTGLPTGLWGVCPGVCVSGVCMLDKQGNTSLAPSVCTPLAPPFHTVGTVGAFASGAVIAFNPDTTKGGARLFVPVRGDPSITWFDIADDRPAVTATHPVANPFLLDCGQASNGGRCNDAHRLGVDPYDNFRDLTLPVEPVGLDVSSDGQSIVSAHQIATAPAVGLTVNQWQFPCPNLSPDPTNPQTGCPSFQYYLTGAVAGGPNEVAHIKPPALIAAAASDPATQIAYLPAFAVTYNATPEVDTFSVNSDAQSSPARPFLTRTTTNPITVNATGTDSRGIAIDTSDRDACEAACAPGPGLLKCLRVCTDTPLLAYIANRAPPSLLLAQVLTKVIDSDASAGTGSGAYDIVNVYGTVPLSLGPSKVVLGKVIGPDGNAKTLVFAVAFDTQRVFPYDPVAQTLLQPISTGRGPHAIAFDTCIDDCGPGEPEHAFLYVGHFTDSYLGVVDLDMRHGGDTFGTMFASIGSPLPPLESK